MKMIEEPDNEALFSYIIEKWLAKSIMKFIKETPLTKEEINTINKFIVFINGEIANITEEADALEQENES